MLIGERVWTLTPDSHMDGAGWRTRPHNGVDTKALGIFDPLGRILPFRRAALTSAAHRLPSPSLSPGLSARAAAIARSARVEAA